MHINLHHGYLTNRLISVVVVVVVVAFGGSVVVGMGILVVLELDTSQRRCHIVGRGSLHIPELKGTVADGRPEFLVGC